MSSVRTVKVAVLVAALAGCGDPAVALEDAGSTGGDDGAAAEGSSSLGGGSTGEDASTTTDGPGPGTSTSSTSGGSDGDGGGSSSSGDDGSGESSGGPAECEEPSGWPSSAAEALERSCAWDPALQTEYVGTITTSADGEVIEDLHVVGGGIVIAHDGVTVRNVTVEGLAGMDAAPITLAAGTQGTELLGVLLGPEVPQWDAACDMPSMPLHGLVVEDGASWQMRGAAFRLVLYAIRLSSNAEVSISDAFIETGRGLDPTSDACPESRSLGISIHGEGASLDVQRTWIDAQPYSMLEEDGPIEQVEVTFTDLSMALRVYGDDTGVDFEQVGMHGGRLALQFYGGTTLSMTNSESTASLFSDPLQAVDGALAIEAWEDNVVDGMPWEAPQ